MPIQKELTGRVTSVQDRNTFKKKKGKDAGQEGTVQNIILKESGTTTLHKIALWDQEPADHLLNKEWRITALTEKADGQFWSSYKTEFDEIIDHADIPDDPTIEDGSDVPDETAPIIYQNENLDIRVLVSRTKNYQKVEYEASGFSDLKHAEDYYHIMNNLAKKQLDEM